MICLKCRRDVPKETVYPIIDNGRESSCCPICALHLINSLNKLPLDTPFRSNGARVIYEICVKHLKSTNQWNSTDMEAR